MPGASSLTIVDNFTRESPAIKVEASIGGRGVVEVPHLLMQQHRMLKTIRVDHGFLVHLEASGPVGLP